MIKEEIRRVPLSIEVSPRAAEVDPQLSACAQEGPPSWGLPETQPAGRLRSAGRAQASASSSMVRLAIGQLLGGRYRIERELAEGGMGVVYLAADEQVPDEKFAIKVLKEELHPAALTLLREEVRKTRKLSHPNIVDVHSVNVDGQRLYVLMEHLEGKSLDALLDEEFGRGMPFSHAWPIIEDVCAALGNAHDHNVIHSDLKPANVFVTTSGRTKLLDFGIARVSRGPLLHAPSGPRALTPAYASCELLEGKEADRRDDIYSFACVIYEMLSGERPFGELTALEARDAGTRVPPFALLSRAQNEALAQALAFDREARTASVEQLFAGLGTDKAPGGRQNAVLGPAIIATVAVLGFTYLALDKLWISKRSVVVQPVAPDAQPANLRAVATTLTFNPPPHSIAVLAFSDLSAEGTQGYFSDGIAEEILNVLAHVNGLEVASRTSSFQFRRSDLGAPAIAQKLGVRHILEGSVRKAGDTVRISAQLIDASTDQHLWSQTFDRPLSTANLFAIQDEIAKSIVDHLAATIGSGADIAKPKERQADTADADAYDLYLKGRSLFIDRSKQNLIAAAGPLKAAVAKDPKFARAWEMLGAVLVTGKYWGAGDESDHQAGADAIEMALRLDPNLSLAYAVRGEFQLDAIPSRGAIGWEDSSESYSRALEHDGTNATAYSWRGANYAALGYLDRAIQDYQRCLDIDPAYELCRRHLAFLHSFLGRTDDALRFYEIGLENGYSGGAVAVLAPAAAARGDRLGALNMLAQQFRGDPQLIRPLFRALTDPTFGDRDRQEALELVNRSKSTGFVIPAALWMLKAYDKSRIGDDMDPPIWWARDDAAWLKSKGRKQAMQHWHLPEYWRKHGFPPQCRPIGEADFECP
jgi:adenylate cyclase